MLPKTIAAGLSLQNGPAADAAWLSGKSMDQHARTQQMPSEKSAPKPSVANGATASAERTPGSEVFEATFPRLVSIGSLSAGGYAAAAVPQLPHGYELEGPPPNGKELQAKGSRSRNSFTPAKWQQLALIHLLYVIHLL